MSQTSPPMYFLATIKLRPGKTEQFCAVMRRIVPIAERQGWKLMGAWANAIGRLNVVTDLWQIPDANSLPLGFVGMMQALDWPELGQGLADCVEDETLQLMARLPYDPGRI